MQRKLLPSTINPSEVWYAVPLDGPERAADLTPAQAVFTPLVMFAPLTDEWYVRIAGIVPQRGPFATQAEAVAAIDTPPVAPKPVQRVRTRPVKKK